MSTKQFQAGSVPLTIGTDPEFMIRNVTAGSITSAIPVIKHGKEDKVYLTKDKAFSIYFDNTMAECNVPPASSEDEMIANLQKLFALSHKSLGANYIMEATASHSFTKAECADPNAAIFGCSPEYCAWTFEEKRPPEGSAGNVFRSAGGHIHIGRSDFGKYEEGQDGVFLMDFVSKAEIIQVMDATVGLALAYLDNDPTSKARKALYGEAGRHRLPIYGVEYRTPGNYWLSSPSLARLVCKLTEFAAQICESGKAQEYLLKFKQSNEGELKDQFAALIKAVNTNDKAYAAKMLSQTLPAELWKETMGLQKLTPLPIPVSWSITDYAKAEAKTSDSKITIKNLKARKARTMPKFSTTKGAAFV